MGAGRAKGKAPVVGDDWVATGGVIGSTEWGPEHHGTLSIYLRNKPGAMLQAVGVREVACTESQQVCTLKTHERQC